jgi:hypothetical protein
MLALYTAWAAPEDENTKYVYSRKLREKCLSGIVIDMLQILLTGGGGGFFYKTIAAVRVCQDENDELNCAYP